MLGLSPPAVSSLSCLVALLMPTPAQVCSVPTTPMHRRSLSPLPHRPTTSRLTARPIGGARTGPCSVTPVGAQSGGTGRRRQRVHGSPQGCGPPGRVPLLARAGVHCRPLTRSAAQPLLCLSARPLPSPPGFHSLHSQLPCPTSSPQPHIATHGRRRPGDAMGGGPPPPPRPGLDAPPHPTSLLGRRSFTCAVVVAAVAGTRTRRGGVCAIRAASGSAHGQAEQGQRTSDQCPPPLLPSCREDLGSP